VTISTTDQYITIVDGTENYGTINTGAIGSVTNGFTIDIDDLVPDQYNVIMELNATNGTETWASYFTITLNAPVLAIGDMVIDDSAGNNDGILDPGETAVITIPANNDGHAETLDAMATLTCGTTGITIGTETVNLGPISIESSADAVYNVSADASIPFGTPIILSFSVEAGEYVENEDFPTQVGIHREDFENGFTEYPWTFQGYEISWPNVNPFEDFTIVGPINDVEWSIDPNEFYSGANSAKSYSITHNQASYMSITLDVTMDGEISFWSKVACEYSPSQEYFYDGLMFRIDDTTMDYLQPDANGQSPWTYSSYPVTAGTHTFDWVYVKDGSDGSTMIEDDCAWVDLITFPSITPLTTGTLAGTVSVIPAANLEDVEIGIGATTINPDATGQFSIEIPVGTYDVSASLEGYETIIIEDVEVLDGQITNISFELYYLQVPENLEAVHTDAIVDLTWDHEQPTENGDKNQVNTSREFQNFNIYRNVDGGSYDLLDTTTDLFYQDVLQNGGEYNYYITALYEQENESDPSNTVNVIWDGTGSGNPLLPVANALYQNMPNPFNPETKISFDLNSEWQVNLEIYNMKGQKVRTLVNDKLSAGQHSIVWDGKDDNSKQVSSGIYFYKIKAGDFQSTRKMLLMK
jgi:hypothetical protein